MKPERGGGLDLTIDLVTGLNADNLYAVDVCVERRETQVVVLADDGGLRLLGKDAILAATFAKAIELGGFKATDLAAALSMSPSNANNRLSD